MDHRKEAAELLDSLDSALDGEYQTAAIVAVGHALLDVADAIREQTAALHLGGIRDDLADIAHAARRPRG